MFLCLVIITVLALTLQSAEGTTVLSETVRLLLENAGVAVESHTLRSNIHILEYFVVGVAVIIFGNNREWKLWNCIIVAAAIGLIDEALKIGLPTREFDPMDLLKDFIGIGLAASIKVFLNNVTRER